MSVIEGVKFPNVTVKLTSIDSNAFSIIGVTSKALRRGGATDEQVKAFQKEATSGPYENLVATVMAWVEVE